MRRWISLLLLLVLVNVQAQLPTGGLVAYYPFNNGAGDESGNKNDGQLNGAVAPAADRFGNPCGAIRFIGTGCYISVPNSVSLKAPSSSLTIAAWIKPERGINSNGDLNLIILAKPGIEAGSDIRPQYCFQLKRVFGDSYSTISLSNDFSFPDKQYNAHPMEFNQWYFIAVTYEENFVQVYQDGKLIAQAPKIKPFLTNDFALEIGRDIVAGKKYFNGCMDDLRLYNRGLSFAEVNALYKDESSKVVKGEVELNFPKSTTKNTESGKCYATVFYTEPTASMGCGSVVLKQISGAPSGSQFKLGSTNLVYQATVGDRLLADSFAITVTDNENPVFKCPTDIIATAKAGTAGVAVSYPGLSATDNCPNLKLRMVEGLSTGSVFPVGVTSLKFEAQDEAGSLQGQQGFFRCGGVQALCAILFGQFFAVSGHHQRRVHINRPGQTQGLLQQYLTRRVVGQIFAAHDMRDALGRVIQHHGQLVSPQAIAALEHKVADGDGHVLLLIA